MEILKKKYIFLMFKEVVYTCDSILNVKYILQCLVEDLKNMYTPRESKQNRSSQIESTR